MRCSEFTDERDVAQMPQYTNTKSHKALFCNRNVHMCAHSCYQNSALWDIYLMQWGWGVGWGGGGGEGVNIHILAPRTSIWVSITVVILRYIYKIHTTFHHIIPPCYLACWKYSLYLACCSNVLPARHGALPIKSSTTNVSPDFMTAKFNTVNCCYNRNVVR